MAIIKAKSAGSHSITVSYGGKTATATLTVNKIDPVLQFRPRLVQIDYNGIARVIGCLEYTGDGEASYYIIKATSQPSVPAENAAGWTWAQWYDGNPVYPDEFDNYYFEQDTYDSTLGGYVVTANGTPAGAGTYYVFAKATAGTTYNAVSPKYVGSYTINKATPYTPVLTAGYLETYNSDSVPVCAKASVRTLSPAGKIYYSSSSGGTTYNITASTTATYLTSMGRSDVGTTTIWAFFAPTDSANYNNSPNVSTTAKISKKATGTISYGVGASSVWCTSTASAATTTDAAKTVKVSTASATTNTGGSITYAVTVKSGTTNITGWSVASDGKTVTTSAATPAGSYTVTVTATAASTTNYTSASTAKTSTVTVSAVALSEITLGLSATTVAYNSTTGVSGLTAKYTNGSTKSILGSLGSASTSNPRIASSDTTIATIINS